jgi:thiol-disulfide isomerase/thioredoxin
MRRFLAALAAAVVLIPGAAGAAADKTLAPVLGAPNWLNGHATAASLAGRVVIVDVFTFDCINCKHVVPELKKLHGEYRSSDVQIVGVHAPETPYERDRSHIVANLAAQGIVWPVALDPDYAIWHAYDNEYWPTQYIFDRHGALRATVVGEGSDERVESTVKALVAER